MVITLEKETREQLIRIIDSKIVKCGKELESRTIYLIVMRLAL